VALTNRSVTDIVIPGGAGASTATRARTSPSDRAQVLAQVLTTAWRARPDPLDIEPERLVEVLPLLVAPSGLAGLAWWRLRHSGGPLSLLRALDDARGLVASQAFLHQRDLLRAVERLRAASVEPILVKGWAIARLYPTPHVRPSSDVDLCVRQGDYRAARRALDRSSEPPLPVDLHRGFRSLDEEDEQVLFDRSVLADCDGTPVRILAPEDHLRVLCCHMLRHGASRPLWLCDVALAVEGRPPGFDWARCLGSSMRTANWITCGIGLAHHLLGARVDDTPLSAHLGPLPRWLVPTVLRQWGKPNRPLIPLAGHVKDPVRLVAESPAHWPNGVQATVALNRPFSGWPRWPYQIVAAAQGVIRFVRDVTRAPRSGE
jgi:hypothetical protein